MGGDKKKFWNFPDDGDDRPTLQMYFTPLNRTPKGLTFHVTVFHHNLKNGKKTGALQDSEDCRHWTHVSNHLLPVCPIPLAGQQEG